MNTILNGVFTVLRFFKSRLFAVGLLTVLLSVTVYAASENINTVYIHDEEQGTSILLHTAEHDVKTILANEEIPINPQDAIEFTGFQDNYGEITIRRAFPVTVQADGQSITVEMTDGTVRDAIGLAGLTVDADDLVSMATTEFVSEQDEIVINRVSYRDTEVEEEIPYEVVERYTPLLRSGRTEVLQAGRSGTRVKTYSERTIDGVTEESALTAERVEARPVTEQRLIGADVPVSQLDFGYQIVNHVPVGYRRVIKGARAAGYSATPGVNGASGNDLFYGHVAVDPNVIPYDTKLYITSSDGRFVYGYAIASDTGVALMQDRIDVDLFYETFRESQLNGIRTVDIYLLD